MSKDNVHSERRMAHRAASVCESLRLGDEYGGWTLCVPKYSLRGQTVYTIGVGANIKWDVGMITRFGTIHHGWDPTPTALRYFANTKAPKGFFVHYYGLGAANGTVTVKLPKGHQHSYTVMEHPQGAQHGTTVNITVLTLRSMMSMMGHHRLAILKMDIEGAEFDVVQSWVNEAYQVPADQVLIEFHHRFFKKKSTLLSEAIRGMAKLGFDVFHISGNVRFTLAHFSKVLFFH